MSLNSEIKSIKKQLSDLYILSKLIFDIKCQKIDGSKISNKVLDHIESLGSNLSKEQQLSLSTKFNSCVRNYNDLKLKNVSEKFNDLEKALKSSYLSTKKLKIKEMGVDSYGTIKEQSSIVSFLLASDKAYKIIKENMKSDYINFKFDKALSFEDYPEYSFIKQLGEVIKSNKLENNDNNSNVINNYSKIKDSFSNLHKLNLINLSIENLLKSLKLENDVDFKDFVNYLNDMHLNNLREIKKCENFLSKFNFDLLRNEVMDCIKMQEKNNEEELNAQKYRALAYKVEQLMNKSPNDIDAIEEAKREMDRFARDSGLSPVYLGRLKSEASMNYYDNKRESELVAIENAEILQKCSAFGELSDSDKKNANAIYAQYLKYCALCADKSSWMSFSEFGKVYYG